MGPVGAAGYAIVASAAVLAVMLGAFAGAIGWATKARVLWAGLLAAAIYLATAVLWESHRLEAAASIGIPPLILTLLIAWLTAQYLETRAKWRRIWAALAALGGALLLGFLWGFSLRLGLREAILMALAADVCLLVLFHLSQKTGLELSRGSKE
jgi:hypothetical protein